MTDYYAGSIDFWRDYYKARGGKPAHWNRMWSEPFDENDPDPPKPVLAVPWHAGRPEPKRDA